MNTEPVQAGKLVAGRFEICARAGAGGMGAVYKAIDRHSRTPVALKVLRKGLVHDLERFAREARVLSSLEHPGIVGYVAHGLTPDGEGFLAMEWLDGEPLSRRLRRGALSVEETLTVARGIASALAAAHARGVVHRDLKPGNLFLRESRVDRVALLDFGLSRWIHALTTLTNTGVVIGTPGYMSPEQARGDGSVDARADVFGFACVIYKCMTGSSPFSADSTEAALAKVLFDEPRSLAERRSDVPAELDALVYRMLSKKPDMRPANGAEVLSALDAIPGDARLGHNRRSLSMRERAWTTAVLVRFSFALEAGETEADIAARLRDERTRLINAIGQAVCEPLADGSFVLLFRGPEDAAHHAGRAAHAALSIKEHSQGAAVTIGSAGFDARDGLAAAISNASALLEEARASGRAVVDRTTAELLTHFDVQPAAAGHLLIAARREPARVQTPFVGRELELARLNATFEECVRESALRAVLITSPAGMGKTRLVDEFVQRLPKGAMGARVYRAAADVTTHASPWSLALDIVRGVLPAQANRELVQTRLSMLPSGTHLASLLFEREHDSDHPQDGTTWADHVARAWQALLREETTKGPVVLVLDHVEMADRASLELFARAFRDLLDTPILAIGMGLPKVHDTFAHLWSDRALEEMRLPPLQKKVAERLVRQMGSFPDEAVERIVTTAEGNAFFLEEIARHAEIHGLATLPANLVSASQEKILNLAREARLVLRAASVFGPRFWRGGIEALVTGAPEAGDVGRWLGILCTASICERAPDSRLAEQDEYVFKSALVREAAYAALTPGDRELGHALAGEWLERAGETNAAHLAMHFELGSKLPRAVGWYLRAADQALAADDVQGAAEFVRRGRRAGAVGAELGALRAVEAQAHNWSGAFRDALSAAVDALTTLPSGSPRWYTALGEAITASGRLGEEARLAEFLRRKARPGADEEARGIIPLTRAAQHLLSQGRLREVEELVERIEQLADDAKPKAPHVRAWLAIARSLRAPAAATIADIRHAATEFEQAGETRHACTMQCVLGDALCQVGDYEGAEAVLRHVMKTAEHLKLESALALAQANLGLVLLHSARLQEAKDLERAAIATLRAQGDARREGMAHLYLALVHVADGDLDRAERHAEDGLTLVASTPALAAYAHAVLARVLFARGHVGDASLHAERAHDLQKELGSLDEGDAFVRLTYIESLDAAGNRDATHNCLRDAVWSIETRARSIPEESLRISFLQRVPENARILAWWAQRGA